LLLTANGATFAFARPDDRTIRDAVQLAFAGANTE
jgi:hypothetical protein